MNNISYETAISIQKQGSPKILAFCIRRSDCSSCNEWMNNFWAQVSAKYQNIIEWYSINTDQTEVPFPPPTSPTWYFYLSTHKDPFIRSGLLPEPEFSFSIDKLVRIQNGEDPFSVFR